jgi:hypothetical protein
MIEGREWKCQKIEQKREKKGKKRRCKEYIV